MAIFHPDIKQLSKNILIDEEISFALIKKIVKTKKHNMLSELGSGTFKRTPNHSNIKKHTKKKNI